MQPLVMWVVNLATCFDPGGVNKSMMNGRAVLSEHVGRDWMKYVAEGENPGVHWTTHRQRVVDHVLPHRTKKLAPHEGD